MRVRAIVVAVGMVAVAGVAGAGPLDLSHLRWYCQHAIATNEAPYSDVTKSRGLAASPDGRYLYLGHNGLDVWPAVVQARNDRWSETPNQFASNTLVRLYGYRGKSIGTDDRGRVYLAEGSGGAYSNSVWWPAGGSPVTNPLAPVRGITIFSPDLSRQLFAISRTNCEGVAVKRERGVLALYATDRNNKTVTRWDLAEDGDAILGATRTGLGGAGEITNAAASNLRGLDLDGAGRIWAADVSGNKVWRWNGDGSGLTNVAVTAAFDVCCMDGRAYVAQQLAGENAGSIRVLDADTMAPIQDLIRPPAQVTGVTNGTFGCLDVLPGNGGIFVHIETADDARPPRLVLAPRWQTPVLHIESVSPTGALIHVE